MPDIAVIGTHPILVLDPKHGRSYTRQKVQKVLTRYAASFSATLTAIVNYYPVRSYPFEVTVHGEKCWLLASGMAPLSAGIQRLELLIRDAVLSSGYISDSAANATLATSVPVRGTSPQASIVFYTSVGVEVDEPSGFWSVRTGRGPEWQSSFEPIIRNHPWVSAVEIRAAPSADNWIVKVSASTRDKPVVWRLSEENPPEMVEPEVFEQQKPRDGDGAKSPSGRYKIHDGPQSRRRGVRLLEVIDTRGEKTFPLIRCYGNFARDYLWSPDESSVAFLLRQGEQDRLMVARLGDRHAMPASLPDQNPRAFGWMTPALLRSLNKL